MVFKFFNKKRGNITPPPKMEELPEFPSDLPGFPSLKEEKLPSLPPLEEELPPLPQIEEPSLKFPKFPSINEEEEIPLHPLKPEIIKKAVEEPKPVPAFKFIKAPGYTFRETERRPERLVREFAKRIPEIKNPEPRMMIVKERKVYVRMENYKIVLGSLNSIKVSLTEFADSVQRLENLNSNQGVNFEKWESILNAIQKKIISVDRTISKS